MKNLDELHCLTPLDGRYGKDVSELREFFSEKALIKYRVKVEVVYLIKLKNLKVRNLNKWSENLTDKDIKRVKKIEEKIKHDVKAVEYLIREKLVKLGLKKLEPWVHWGLTSEDVNSLAYGLMLQEAKDKVLVKNQTELVKELVKMAEKYSKVVMPGRTHGQLAVPTTIGKELVVFASRMSQWLKEIKELKLGGKLNGAVGNFNAHQKFYPEKDWLKFSRELVEGLGLSWTMITTQIEPRTRMVKLLDLIRQFNNVGLDLAKDMWLYIAFDYLKQRVVKDEVGSSTMPQKVNPINFENAEGNFELANGVLMTMSNKLSQSRMQRDLSDSTVRRNLGVALGYSLVAMKSLLKGLERVEPNKDKLKQELEDHPEMLAEAWQLGMKTRGDERAYEKVKQKYSRLRTSNILGEVEEYVGLAEKLVSLEIKKIKKEFI
ncbi:MAG: adenylosuccinate lyase [Candidatus Beckwithbacteria bacterium]